MPFYQNLKNFILDATSVFLPPYIPQFPYEYSEPSVEQNEASGSSVNYVMDISETSSSSMCVSFCTRGAQAYTPGPFFLALPEFNMDNPRVESIVSYRKKKESKLEQYLPVISTVTEELMISGMDPASDLLQLIDNDVGGVLNCCGDLMPEPINRDIPNFVLKLKDSQYERVDWMFYECFCFIQGLRMRKKRVLVHCYQGVSRSASIVIAYLMLANNLTYLEAFAAVRIARPIISPNMSFVYQMVSWWKLRHMNTFGLRRCQQISQRYACTLRATLYEESELQSAIRDISENQLIKCQIPSTNVFAPICYRLGVFREEQPIFCLKSVQPDYYGRIPAFDPRFVYFVFGFHDVSLVLVGSQVQLQTPKAAYHQFGVSGQPPRILDQLATQDTKKGAFDAYQRIGLKTEQATGAQKPQKEYLQNPFQIEQIIKRNDRAILQTVYTQLYQGPQFSPALFAAIGRQILLMHIFEMVSLRIRFVFQQDFEQLCEVSSLTQQYAVLVHLLDCFNCVECNVSVVNGKQKFDAETHAVAYDTLSVSVDGAVQSLNIYDVNSEYTWEFEKMQYLAAQ